MRAAAASARSYDAWDRRSRAITGSREQERLAELARRYLLERKDHALGLAPTRLLPPRKARAWLLFWTAARRIDDSLEARQTDAQHWREVVESPGAASLAERCLDAFLQHPEGAGTRGELAVLLRRGLDGLARESRFDRPRSLQEYLDLIHDKSATAMLILDRLLFAGESQALLRRHAEAFAATTQVGDDCRDVVRDLRAGRCFVTLEELGSESALRAFIRSQGFRRQRTEMCRFLLGRADMAAARFASGPHRGTAKRLSSLWSHAIETGQIRPTTRPLRLPRSIPLPSRGSGKSRDLAAPILGLLRKRLGGA